MTLQFLVSAADMLLLPQPTITTAIVFHHKHSAFYDTHPQHKESRLDDHTEVHRKVRDIVNVVYHLVHKDGEAGLAPKLTINSTFWRLKESVISAELILLRILAFDVHVALPFNHLTQILSDMREKQLRQWVGTGRFRDEAGVVRWVCEMAFNVAAELMADRTLCVDVACKHGGDLVIALAAAFLAMEAAGFVLRQGFDEWCAAWNSDADIPQRVTGEFQSQARLQKQDRNKAETGHN
eukprot:jgi/Hompol1/5805/HPOL_004743-RA